MRHAILAGLGLLLAAGGASAQTLDTSREHTQPLASSAAATPGATAQATSRAFSPRMTRAVARRNAQGELVVKCHVEDTPPAAAARHAAQLAPARK